MKSILLYNLYLVNHWKEVTKTLLKVYDHDDLVVNINADKNKWLNILDAIMFLRQYQPKKILFTINDRQLGEVKGFEKMKKNVNLKKYGILTYIHSKGVSKPNHPFEPDWRELMRYFVLEKFDLTLKAFSLGYYLYGVNLTRFIGFESERQYCYKYCDFWYRGNFVSVNLEVLREMFENTPVPADFYGVEAFWGNLCTYDKAYCAHESGVSHYQFPYPEDKYKC